MKAKINIDEILVGSDFEMFLQNDEGKVISAIPFNAGTKQDPQKLPVDGCCIQRDGVLQECNVPPVRANEWAKFAGNVDFVKEFILNAFAKKRGLKLVCCPSAEIEDDQLLDPEAHQIGCDPDFNAWENGEVNEKAEGFAGNLRSCGGHLHFSYPGAEPLKSMDLMKCFDLFLTVPFMLIDEDIKRRELYGKAGSFRICDWGEAAGFEARTLSNFWVSDKKYIKYVFEQINQMFDHYNKFGTKKVNKDKNIIVDCINNNNIEAAMYLCEKYDIKMLKKLEMA